MDIEKNSTITITEDGEPYEFLVLEILENSIIALDLDNDTECEIPFENLEEEGLKIDIKKYER